jgi:PEGA domain
MCRKVLGLLFAFLLTAGATLSASDNQLLAELRFVAHNGAEKKAGVWVDGQYVGYVKELNGDKKMLLLPGKHQIVVRQAWYQDYVEQALLEPGEIHTIKLAMAKQSMAGAESATSELKIVATPPRAAVFVDEQFAGHVDEFDGAGKGMLLTPGKHRVRIALPGYLPFETVVDLRPHQKLKLQTELEKGSIIEAGSLVSKD